MIITSGSRAEVKTLAMSEEHKTDHRPQPNPEPRPPYQPPAVAWEEEWDIRANLAAACAKSSGGGEGCEMDLAS
jgi:hypothetical protein